MIINKKSVLWKNIETKWYLVAPESKKVCIDDIFSVLKEMNGIYV